jgi:phage terminase large subunit-like protein
MAIADELHGYANGDVINALRTGTGARINSMIFIISTAGANTQSYCNEYLKHHQSILEGKIDDDTLFGMLYMPDVEDKMSDPEIWVKSNPALNYIISLDDLKTSFYAAQYSYRDQFFFLTKHLNIFADSPDVWVPEEYLSPLFEDFDETPLYGKDAHIGMDLSKNTDLSSIVLYINDGDISYAIPYFWMADMENNVIRPNGRDLFPWITDGYITKCKTKTIDLDLIYDKIVELSTQFNIVSLQYDPYNSPVLVSKLKEYGLNCEKFQQNASRFNSPLKSIEEMIYNKKIKMKNPVLLWNFQNVVLYVDSNANIKIVKNKQNDSVDGCVALAMSIGGWIQSTYGDEIMGLNSYIESSKK